MRRMHIKYIIKAPEVKKLPGLVFKSNWVIKDA